MKERKHMGEEEREREKQTEQLEEDPSMVLCEKTGHSICTRSVFDWSRLKIALDCSIQSKKKNHIIHYFYMASFKNHIYHSPICTDLKLNWYT